MTSCSHKLIVLEFPSTRYMYLQILKNGFRKKSLCYRDRYMYMFCYISIPYSLKCYFDFCRITKDVDMNSEEGKKEMKKMAEEKEDPVKKPDTAGPAML